MTTTLKILIEFDTLNEEVELYFMQIQVGPPSHANTVKWSLVKIILTACCVFNLYLKFYNN